MTQTENFQNNQAPLNLPVFVTSESEEETFALGQRLAALLEKGSIVALRGQLGAGKTCLTKGLARGLGIDEEITSPSYTIVSEYKAAVLFYHIDAFRLKGDDDFYAIGGEDIIFGNGISVIEWSERIPNLIPNLAIKIDIEILGDNKRRFHIYKD